MVENSFSASIPVEELAKVDILLITKLRLAYPKRSLIAIFSTMMKWRRLVKLRPFFVCLDANFPRRLWSETYRSAL